MAADAHSKQARMAAAYLKKGQELYAENNQELAKVAFERAMNCCSCRIDVCQQPSIKDEIMAGIAGNKLKGVLASMSSSTRRCDDQVHLQALDSLIATHETQSRWDECLELAVKMVNLSPREPTAYLRLGKILRKRAQRNLAFQMYKQGIEIVRRKHPQHPMLPALCAQKDKISASVAFDPVSVLPIELVRMIFRLVSFRTRCRSLRVSKTWHTTLTSISLKDLWQVQSYDLVRRSHGNFRRIPVSFKAYRTYGRNNLTELSIDGCSHFLRWCKFSDVITLSKHLKVLKLRDRLGHNLEPFPNDLKILRLRSLHFGYGVRPHRKLLQQLIAASSSSLEELSVFELPSCGRTPSPHERWYPGWPKLEKLRAIHLAGLVRGATSPLPFDLNGIMELAPNVEEAWIDCLIYSPEELMRHWRKLRNLFVGCNTITRTDGGGGDTEASLSEDMREMHIEARSIHSHFAIPRLPKLEKLSLLSGVPLEPSSFESIVRPSLESGALQELDVRPFPRGRFFDEPPHWFKSESITYLSLTGFTKESIHQQMSFQDALLNIVDRFPNLHSIDVSDELFPDALLAKLIQRGVKTVYYRGGSSKADLRDWAAKNFDAQLIGRPPAHIPSMNLDRQRFYNQYLQFSNHVLP